MFFEKIKKSPVFGFSIRITFWYLSVYALTFGLLIFLANHFLNQSFEEKSRELLISQAQEYAAWFEEGGLNAVKTRFTQKKAQTSEAFFIRVVGFLGNALFIKFPEGHENLNTDILNNSIDLSQPTFLTVASKENDSHWKVFSLPLRAGAVIQVGQDISKEQKFLKDLKDILLRLTLPFLILGLLGGWFITYRATHPIRRLTRTVKEILATGKLGKRVPAGERKEFLNELIVLFNRLMDQNENLILRMHEGLDAAAHDLRTPLARLRGSAELTLQKQKASEEDYREALADCLEESQRLTEMLNVFMDVAEAQSGAMKLHRESFDLVRLIGTAIDIYEISAEEAGVEVEYNGPKKLEVQGDRVRLQQAILNLVDNALKYIGDGQRIDIRLKEKGSDWILEVEDDGMGIPDSDRQRIFDRLYRVDRARSQQKGLGLGLSFVKAIAEAHNGDVTVQSQEDKGSTFTLRIPKSGI